MMNWAEAEAEFKRVIALNPRSTHANSCVWNYLMTVGRFEEAAAIARQAVDLDPLSAYAIFQVVWGAQS